MHMTRRHHQKSRGGCQTCKSKKIKCDELKPRCQYCTMRSLNCVYAGNIATQASSSSMTPEIEPSRSHSSLSTSEITGSTVSSPATVAVPASLPAYPPINLVNWTLLDLELLHFYTSSTSLAFSASLTRQHIWRDLVPQIAFSHHFILHGILALAAAHLSTKSPERKLSLQAAATAHHARALPMFRSALEILSLENHEACAIFGVLISIYEWASSVSVVGLFLSSSHDRGASCEWVSLLRGSGKIIEAHYQEIANGPFAQIFSLNLEFEAEARASPAEASKFDALRLLWKEEVDAGNSTANLDVETYDSAVEWLQILYTSMCKSTIDNSLASLALTWFFRVPDQYLTRLDERQPVALVILAHFSLLLNRIPEFWWNKGMSRHLLHEIHDMLGEEWVEFLSWPMQDLVLCEFKQQSGLTKA